MIGIPSHPRAALSLVHDN